MFDLGWSELLVVAMVAIIVVGPKDLPKLMRTVGQWVRRARSLASEFQRGMMDLADADDDLKDLKNLKKEVEEATNFDMAGPDFSKSIKAKPGASASPDEAKAANGKAKPKTKKAKKAAGKKSSGKKPSGKKSADKPKSAKNVSKSSSKPKSKSKPKAADTTAETTS